MDWRPESFESDQYKATWICFFSVNGPQTMA